MIDIATEDIFPLAELPKRLPARRRKKPLHISTVFRWAASGINGVVLETIRVGGALHTSIEAVQRFSEALTAKRNSHGDAAPIRTPTQRRQSQKQAAKILDAAGIK